MLCTNVEILKYKSKKNLLIDAIQTGCIVAIASSSSYIYDAPITKRRCITESTLSKINE